jgi:hypothetical protein
MSQNKSPSFITAKTNAPVIYELSNDATVRHCTNSTLQEAKKKLQGSVFTHNYIVFLYSVKTRNWFRSVGKSAHGNVRRDRCLPAYDAVYVPTVRKKMLSICRAEEWGRRIKGGR